MAQRRAASEEAAHTAHAAEAAAVAEESALRERSHRLAAGFAAVRTCCRRPAAWLVLSRPPRSGALTRPPPPPPVQAVQRVQDHAPGQTASTAGPEAARLCAAEAEVGRVLGALTDADALGLPPHPPPDAVRRAYRALAKQLHPDKCGAEGATDAFQRVARAYQRLGGQ